MFFNKRSNDEFIKNIAKSLVQSCYLDKDGKIVFLDTIDYEKFRHTVSFISEYEKEYGKTNNEKINQIKTKKRKK